MISSFRAFVESQSCLFGLGSKINSRRIDSDEQIRTKKGLYGSKNIMKGNRANDSIS